MKTLLNIAKNSIHKLYTSIRSAPKKEAIAFTLFGTTYTGVLAYAHTQKNKESSLFKKAMAGSLACLMTESMLFPIDTVNMKYKAAEDSNKSMLRFAKDCYKKNGVKFFTKGCQPMLYLCSISGAIYFSLYEHLRERFNDFNAAAMSEFCLMLFLYPLDVIKTRMQVSQGNNIKFGEEIHNMKLDMAQSKSAIQSIKSVYTGFVPNMVTNLGFIYGQYGFYMYFRSYFKKTTLKAHEALCILLASSLSGMIASTYTNGFETVTVLMQSRNGGDKMKLPELTPELFTRGMSIRICYNVVMSIIEFFLVENVYKLFGEKFCK